MPACLIGRGAAEDAADARFASWQRVEASDALREYKERLKDAAAVDQASRTFLLEDALPQLAREENRGSIERVRRRMRDVLLGEIGQQALAAANAIVADFMDSLARDGAADPLVRVNAAILIGELRVDGNRPWPDVVPRLSALVADRRLSMGVRIAAMAGLSRPNVPVAATQQSAEAVGRAVTAILEEEPAAPGRPEQDWLLARAVSLLPAVMTEYPEPVAAGLVRILVDESRSTDLRVRAAASLAARVGPKSAIDPGAAITAIESLAVRSLAGDLSAVERNRFDQEYRQFVGGKADGQGGRPGNRGEEVGIPEQVVRREAWRLFTLAGSLDGGDGAIVTATSGGGKGLAGAAKAPLAEKARTLAAVLREEASSLDGDPTERTLVASLERLRPAAKKPGAVVPDGDGSDPAVAEGDEPSKPRRRGRRNPVDAADPAPQASPFESNPAGT